MCVPLVRNCGGLITHVRLVFLIAETTPTNGIPRGCNERHELTVVRVGERYGEGNVEIALYITNPPALLNPAVTVFSVGDKTYE